MVHISLILDYLTICTYRLSQHKDVHQNGSKNQNTELGNTYRVSVPTHAQASEDAELAQDILARLRPRIAAAASPGYEAKFRKDEQRERNKLLAIKQQHPQFGAAVATSGVRSIDAGGGGGVKKDGILNQKHLLMIKNKN